MKAFDHSKVLGFTIEIFMLLPKVKGTGKLQVNMPICTKPQ